MIITSLTPPSFGTYLAGRMFALSMTRATVIRRLDRLGCSVSRQKLSSWLRDERRPRYDVLVLLLDVLQVHGAARGAAVDLLGREPTTPTTPEQS